MTVFAGSTDELAQRIGERSIRIGSEVSLTSPANGWQVSAERGAGQARVSWGSKFEALRSTLQSPRQGWPMSRGRRLRRTAQSSRSPTTPAVRRQHQTAGQQARRGGDRRPNHRRRTVRPTPAGSRRDRRSGAGRSVPNGPSGSRGEGRTTARASRQCPSPRAVRCPPTPPSDGSYRADWVPVPVGSCLDPPPDPGRASGLDRLRAISITSLINLIRFSGTAGHGCMSRPRLMSPKRGPTISSDPSRQGVELDTRQSIKRWRSSRPPTPSFRYTAAS